MKDQHWDVAMFQELSSSPAALEAAKLCDLISCLPGHAGEMADATQAYTQSYLKGPKTWVSLPKDQWPKQWFDDKGRAKYREPVVPLIRALYGHPDSGGYWERHCEAHLRKVGVL